MVGDLIGPVGVEDDHVVGPVRLLEEHPAILRVDVQFLGIGDVEILLGGVDDGGVDLDHVDGHVVLVGVPFRAGEPAPADEQYPVHVGIVPEQERHVEVAGVPEDVPVRLVEVHRAVADAVQVQRPDPVVVGDTEFLVCGLGLVDGAVTDGGVRRQREREHEQDHRGEDAAPGGGVVAVGQRERGDDEDGTEDALDQRHAEVGDQRERRRERADDAADGPEGVDVAGGAAGALGLDQFRGVGADEPEQDGRRPEENGDRDERRVPLWNREVGAGPDHPLAADDQRGDEQRRPDEDGRDCPPGGPRGRPLPAEPVADAERGEEDADDRAPDVDAAPVGGREQATGDDLQAHARDAGREDGEPDRGHVDGGA